MLHIYGLLCRKGLERRTILPFFFASFAGLFCFLIFFSSFQGTMHSRGYGAGSVSIALTRPTSTRWVRRRIAEIPSAAAYRRALFVGWRRDEATAPVIGVDGDFPAGSDSGALIDRRLVPPQDFLDLNRVRLFLGDTPLVIEGVNPFAPDVDIMGPMRADSGETYETPIAGNYRRQDAYLRRESPRDAMSVAVPLSLFERQDIRIQGFTLYYDDITASTASAIEQKFADVAQRTTKLGVDLASILFAHGYAELLPFALALLLALTNLVGLLDGWIASQREDMRLLRMLGSPKRDVTLGVWLVCASVSAVSFLLAFALYRVALRLGEDSGWFRGLTPDQLLFVVGAYLLLSMALVGIRIKGRMADGKRGLDSARI